MIDRLWQLGYAVAYRLLRLWWHVRRPAHRGALVAVWHSGEILVLRIVVGLSAEETAEIVGASAGAVRVAQHRALTRLRKTAPRSLVQDQT